MTIDDPDLPGDERFRPLPPEVCISVDVGGGRRAWAMAMTLPAEDQAAIHHNRLRYAELQLLRMGQPNRYHASRYR